MMVEIVMVEVMEYVMVESVMAAEMGMVEVMELWWLRR